MSIEKNRKYTFLSKKYSSVPDEISGVDIVFLGEQVDDRGVATIDALRSKNNDCRTVRFDVATQCIYLNGEAVRRIKIEELITGKKRVLLDATTLGLGEILQILIIAGKIGLTEIEFLYTEPRSYSQKNSLADSDQSHRKFDLTRNCKFRAIQGFAHEYDSSQNATHIFFLGFEPGRIRNAIEQRGEIDAQRYKCHMIVGVPAFQTGWETNSIRPHLSLMEELYITERSITYCSANSIRETYLTLWQLYDELGDERHCFYVSPLGTKPHAVGTALFLFETKGNEKTTSLYYDHPERIAQRSSEIGTWHHVKINF
jgi:hypothetical protein